MSKDERKLLDDLRGKSVEAAAEMMAGVQRLKNLHEEIAGEDFDADRTRLGDFLYKLAKLELEHASNIVHLGNMQAEMLFEQVRRLARRARGGGAPNKVLDIVAELGHATATGSFQIRNPFDREADARFEIGALRTQAATLDPPLRVIARCDGAVPPHATADVVVEVSGTEQLAVGDVRFGELVVYLSADVELEVARRLVKVKVRA